MKIFINASIFLGLCIFLVACGQSIIPTASPVPSLIATATATIPPLPTNTSTPIITSTVQPEYVAPTLIPTIAPTLVPDLFKSSISLQSLESIDGHNLKKITGWQYGLARNQSGHGVDSYFWLDSNHLLFYPLVGQRPGLFGNDDLAFQPVAINISTGNFWLPSNRLAVSEELEVLFTTETQDSNSTVSTYTFDGHKLASYPGKLTGVSPSGTKILIDNNILIDLRTNSRTTLAWSLDDYEEQMLSAVFWTSGETRLYRCCYFYADLNIGTSYRFGNSDFVDRNGNPFEYDGLWLYRGQWVLNDALFLATWSMVDDGDIRYLPLFDPAKRQIYDVRRMAGISEELSCPDTNVSTHGTYVWVECDERNYLINLTTFEANEYPIPIYSNPDIGWSVSDQFAWIQNYNYDLKMTEYFLLSLSNKELTVLATMNPIVDSWPYLRWHPIKDVFAYITQDAQKFELFDAPTMTTHGITLTSAFRNFVWDPMGDCIALIADDGSIWQVEYPNLKNVVQLTSPLPNVSDVDWSPDGNFISFISGTDIYIVETAK